MNGTTLTQVNRQWSSRPEDETFDSLEAAYIKTKEYAQASIEKDDVIAATIRAEVLNDDVVLVGKGDRAAQLTHWSFGQLSQHADAPASYLRNLPATLACQNLNYGLKKNYGDVQTAIADVDAAAKLNLYLHVNGDKLTVRSLNSERYSRIYNHELLAKLIDLQAFGWTNPRPFNQGDRVSTVWASDHDMFVFQVNDENLIKVPGEDRYLRRGFIMSNSEVGGGAWDTLTFVFDYMCCNRLIWGAQHIGQIKVRHVGDAANRVESLIQQFRVEMTKYANGSANLEEAKIAAARSKVIAATKEDVIESVFKHLRGNISRKSIESGYVAAELNPDTTAGPNTVWGLANGITRYSQTIPYADERTKLDRAAGKLVEAAAAF